MQYPPNMRIIRVMCSGRVDPTFILNAFSMGTDGIMVLGCHPGDCHYISGNLMAERKMMWSKNLMEKVGIPGERLRLEWISASEGERFATTAKEFTEKIGELGPLKDADWEGILSKLKAACATVSRERFRILLGKERELVEEGNVYGDLANQADLDNIIDNVMVDEYTREQILLLSRNEPLSVREMAERLGLPSNIIGKHVMWLRHRGRIALDGIKDRSPIYKTVEVGK
jgi:coenzyme F420-reducing hydrogenase delta subunit